MDKARAPHVNSASPLPGQASKPNALIDVAPRSDKPRVPPIPAKEPATAPVAAAGETMSRQQQSVLSVDEIKGTWKQQVGAARSAWSELTDDELLKTEGHAQKLAGLVQERYAISCDEADKQVKSFLAKHNS